MDERLREILEALPRKPPRSRLEPYREFIEELRRLGRTYREIAAILAEKCQLQVSSSAVHEFVQIRPRRKGMACPQSSPKSRRPAVAPEIDTGKALIKVETDSDIRRRIAALKLERETAEPMPERFEFDPSEPLRLKKLGGKKQDE